MAWNSGSFVGNSAGERMANSDVEEEFAKYHVPA